VYLSKQGTVLHITAKADPPAYILQQILRMVDIDFCSQLNDFGNTPLSLICIYGRDLDAIRLLALERPQDFHVPNQNGRSPCYTLMIRNIKNSYIEELDRIDEADIAQIFADTAEAWPDVFLHVDEYGQTLLQRALRFTFSVNDFILIRKILAIQPELIAMTDSRGASVIHFALRRDDHDDDEDVVDRLELLLECGGSHGLCVQDSYSGTPLHEACTRIWHLPRDIFMTLVANHPSALYVRDRGGMTPLDTLHLYYDYFLKKDYTGLDWEEKHSKLADVAMTLLTGAPVRCTDLPSLHDLLRSQDCTSDIAKLLTYALRDQTSLEDGNGNLPLHIVASRHYNNDIMYEEIIETLLELYPAACQISNSERTLPLQLMHRSGKSWSKGMRMVLLQHPAALLDLELNRVAICALLAKVGSEEQPDALFRLVKDALTQHM
jgi:ankyrin repeat protein